MKYESNILKRLIDTYGVVGNPRYISEIIKEFIVQGKERFPNLFTYQADWLAHIDEFGLNPSYTVSYTGQSIYAPNTLERPVKSVILTGQTLVNITSLTGEITLIPAYSQFIETPLVKQNTTYTFMFNCTSAPSTGTIEFRQMLDNATLKEENISIVQGYNKFKVTTVNKELNRFRFKNTSTSETDFVFNNLVIIEGNYTNVDITYFEGMQSVQMPVLTTTGKNLLNPSTIEFRYDNTICVEDYTYNNGIYTLTNTKNNNQMKIIVKKQFSDKTLMDEVLNVYDLDGNKYSNYYKAVDGSDDEYEWFSVISNWNPIGKVEIKLGYESTEPYKSNILTVNEDVTLRGIGDVRDTLDLMTGEVTERIGEVVLDGNEDWIRQGVSQNNSNLGIYYSPKALPNTIFNTNNVLCDKFKSSKTMAWHSSEEDIYVSISTYGLKICFDERKLESATVGGFKKWLSENTPTIQYPLVEKPVKTVDLNILDQNGQNIKQLISFNGGTHFITGSAEGSPMPVVSVSVVTDLEETLRVCSLEGNTL